MRIESKVIPNAYWEIDRQIIRNDDGSRALKYSPEIFAMENEFIANYSPVIYNNDLTGKLWSYDTKLPTGGWLENITAKTKDGKIVYKALILC